MNIELLFHDSTTVIKYRDVTTIVHGPAAVTIYTPEAIYTHPWINVQRIKVPVQQRLTQEQK